MKKVFSRLMLAAILLCSGIVSANNSNASKIIKQVNDAHARVVDLTNNTLTQSQIQSIDNLLKKHEQETTNQIAVVVIPSLEENDPKSLSLEIAEKGFGGKGLGTAQNDNGVLLFFAMKEHQIRIEVGHGLEGVLPDGLCGRIRDSEIIPHFKQGNYYTGISNGIDKIIAAIKGEYKSNYQPNEISKGLIAVIALGAIILCTILVIIISLAESSGSTLGTGGFLDSSSSYPSHRRSYSSSSYDSTSSYSSSSSFSSPSDYSGGGGFSGGGGSFGGGGAGGSW